VNASVVRPDAGAEHHAIEDLVERLMSAYGAHDVDALTRLYAEIERTIVEPGRFVLDWTERGAHLGRLRMGGFAIPTRGRSLSWRGVSIYELADGEIASVDYFVDRLVAAEQLVKPVALALRLWTRLTRSRDDNATRREEP
jgi:predicted ester cyclase